MRTARTVLAALALSLAASAAALAEPVVGKPAPGFSAVDSNGKPVNLAHYKGKVIVLEWTNDGCPYVQKHYNSGNMQALQKEATAGGVVWLTIASSAKGQQGYVDGATANKHTAERKAAPTAFLLDPEGKVGRAYDARVTPHMYVIDGEGVLAYMGAIDDKPTSNVKDVPGARNYVKLALAAVQAGKPVAEKVTRAYGCTVKY